ncbi:hypothetical protein BDP55DRAFT_675507, partial [Colletotrichum godetiae]
INNSRDVRPFKMNRKVFQYDGIYIAPREAPKLNTQEKGKNLHHTPTPTRLANGPPTLPPKPMNSELSSTRHLKLFSQPRSLEASTKNFRRYISKQPTRLLRVTLLP